MKYLLYVNIYYSVTEICRAENLQDDMRGSHQIDVPDCHLVSLPPFGLPRHVYGDNHVTRLGGCASTDLTWVCALAPGVVPSVGPISDAIPLVPVVGW